MKNTEVERLARNLLRAMSEQGPVARLDVLDSIERDSLPTVWPIIARARQLVRNGI